MKTTLTTLILTLALTGTLWAQADSYRGRIPIIPSTGEPNHIANKAYQHTDHVVDVRDYGAKGDVTPGINGVAESGNVVFTWASAAWVAADVGKPIYIMGAGAAGARLDTTIASVTPPTSITLTVAPSSDVAAADFWYGTDDTAAIQAAIDAAPTGAKVFFPRGTYLHSGLTVTASSGHNGVILEGVGGPLSTSVSPSILLCSDTDANGVTVTAQSVAIRGLVFTYGLSGDQPTGDGHCIQLGTTAIHAYDNIIENCWFVEYPQSAIYQYNGDIHMRTCTFEIGHQGIYTRRGTAAGSIDITGCWFGGMKAALDLDSINSISMISGNSFGICGAPSKGGVADVNLVDCYQISFVNNTFYQSQGHAFDINDCNTISLIGNTIRQPDKHGIWSRGGSGLVVSGNNIVRFDAGNASTYSGICLGAGERNYTIVGNTAISDYTPPGTDYGIYGLDLSAVTIMGQVLGNKFQGKTGTILWPASVTNTDFVVQDQGRLAIGGLTPLTQLQIGSNAGAENLSGDLYVLENAYYSSGWKYKADGFAGALGMTDGALKYYTAASGTAGNAVTLKEIFGVSAGGIVSVKNGGTDSGRFDLYEDSDNGEHKVIMQPPASMASDYAASNGSLILDDGTNWRLTLTIKAGLIVGVATAASSGQAATWTAD